ncbi:protein of unknown function [Caloramator quimbayensis]|uniref:DUF4397 domain-containing protein n=1 Tax=Caloramator quimbayensis TaxID=1147123 RepID=A0A1T4Y4L3_9CLOT|nr:DUF4397 domain-containing protein [Caloramator quimbayensis]SKA96690.1 protein of unknown function [Caloramator quimbayensis]
MYNYPFSECYNCPLYRMKPQVSYVRILHASPNTPAVDVYANDKIIAKNLSYRNFTQYIGVPVGEYRIKVFKANTTQNPLIDTSIELPGSSAFTVAAIGMLPNINLFPIVEHKKPLNPDKLYLRFAHLSPDAPAVDIVTPDGNKLFEDISYKEVADYIEISPGTYSVNVNIAGTNNTVLTVPNIRLLPNRYYTIYAVGLAGGKPSLQVLIPLDGASYLRE